MVKKKIAENFNRLSRAHQRHRQTTDGSAIAYSEREREFTSAKNRKMVISTQQFDWLTWHLAWWFTLALQTILPFKISNLKNPRWPITAILKNRWMAISRQRLDRSARYMALWFVIHIYSENRSADKNMNCYKSLITVKFNYFTSAVVWFAVDDTPWSY